MRYVNTNLSEGEDELQSFCVGVIGIHFRTAPLFLQESMARWALQWKQGISDPCVLLSTCNRVEIYFGSKDFERIFQEVGALFLQALPPSYHQVCYTHRGADCLAHLSRVCSGMDSAIVAETEIQCQVKRAYSRASESQILPSSLHFLFQKALKISKESRSFFRLEKGGIHLTSLIGNCLREHMPDWREKRVLFVGYSQMNRQLIHYLSKKGLSSIHVCTRFQDPLPWTLFDRDILSFWGDYDLLFCASHSLEHLIVPQNVSWKQRMIFDLSIPRVVDPEVAFIKGIALYNMDHLQKLMREKQQLQEEDWDRCERWIRERAIFLSYSYRVRDSDQVGQLSCST